MDHESSVLLRREVWNETRSRNETKIQRERRGVATVQLSATEFLGQRDTDRKKSYKKGEPSDMLRLLITGIHLSVPFIKG